MFLTLSGKGTLVIRQQLLDYASTEDHSHRESFDDSSFPAIARTHTDQIITVTNCKKISTMAEISLSHTLSELCILYMFYVQSWYGAGRNKSSNTFETKAERNCSEWKKKKESFSFVLFVLVTVIFGIFYKATPETSSMCCKPSLFSKRLLPLGPYHMRVLASSVSCAHICLEGSPLTISAHCSHNYC